MISAPSIHLDPIQDDDCLLLFKWLSDPDCLAGKLENTGSIDPETHRSWFSDRLIGESCFIYLIKVDGVPAGQIRFEKKNGLYEIDIYVVPTMRRMKLAQTAISLGRERMIPHIASLPIVARVKNNNMKSKSLFESLGFFVDSMQSDCTVYHWRPEHG